MKMMNLHDYLLTCTQIQALMVHQPDVLQEISLLEKKKIIKIKKKNVKRDTK